MSIHKKNSNTIYEILNTSEEMNVHLRNKLGFIFFENNILSFIENYPAIYKFVITLNWANRQYFETGRNSRNINFLSLKFSNIDKQHLLSVKFLKRGMDTQVFDNNCKEWFRNVINSDDIENFNETDWENALLALLDEMNLFHQNIFIIMKDLLKFNDKNVLDLWYKRDTFAFSKLQIENLVEKKLTELQITSFNKTELSSIIYLKWLEYYIILNSDSNFESEFNKLIESYLLECNQMPITLSDIIQKLNLKKPEQDNHAYILFKLAKDYWQKKRVTPSSLLTYLSELYNSLEFWIKHHIILTTSDLQMFIKKLLDIMENEIMNDEAHVYFWHDKSTPKSETEIQPFVGNQLIKLCALQEIAVTKEPQMAGGKVDFLCSYKNLRCCLEIKLAQHQDVTVAANTQLIPYLISQNTKYGIFLVFWYKSENYKRPSHKSPLDLELEIQKSLQSVPYQILIKIINVCKPTPPSKIKTLHK